ncbi:MAG: hypothetical protein ABIN91_00190 [Mucilaginibacter sp.]|uniref:hypothetical protein n=1 Tax=Mucilaginibacter sp. TaxID=1882438 RepID=UPI003265A4EC
MKVTSIKPGVTAMLLLALFSCKKPGSIQQSDPDATALSKQTTASNFPALVPSETVSVDFNVDQGAMTYRASGLLAGLVPIVNASPPDYLVVPTKPQFHRVKMSYLGPLKPRHDALGLTTILVLSDDWGYHRGSWPGDGGNWTEYDTFLTNEYNQAISYGYADNKLHFDIWNEADGIQFWDPAGARAVTNATAAMIDTNRRRFCETYVHAFKKLKALAANLGRQIVIEGPSLSIIKYKNPVVPDIIDYPFFSRWLDSAKANTALPDYLAWHFPGSSNTLTAKTPSQEIDDVRGMYAARGLAAPLIIINEFISNVGTSLHANPGKVGWLAAQHERAGIVGSVHAQFSGPENQMDNMIFRENNEWKRKGEWWWFMKYGNITGHKVSTTPSANIDLIAGKDVDSSLAKIVLGNRSGLTGPIAVQLNNLDKSYAMEGKGVFVTIEKIPWANGGEVTKTDTVLQGTYTVSASHQLTLVFDWGTDARDSYAITLGSKHQSTIYEAESLAIDSYSSGDVVRVFADPAASGGAGSIIDDNAIGDFVSYTIPTVGPGTYYVSAKVKRYSSRGIFQFKAGITGAGGSDIGAPYDEYNPTPEYIDANLGKWKVGTSTTKYFKFTVTGANASSADPFKYGLAFDYFTFTKIAP